jgi:glycosyltransferase involved in cell wall biosynthesis
MPISDLFTKSDVPPPSDGPVLAVGRLVHEKGFDVLVEAVGQIDENERREIVIVGEGPEREPLAVQAESYGLTLNMPGALSPDEVRDWYQKASFVVVPSRREGFGLVAAEAAMSGRAVIGSRVGGIPDVIQHGVSGLIVEPGDIEGLMAAIQNIDVGWGLAVPKNVLHLGAGWHTDFLTKIYGVN